MNTSNDKRRADAVPNSERLTLIHVYDHYRKIKSALGMTSPILRQGAVERITDEAFRLNPGWPGENYPNYEIGFRFIVDHMVGSLKERISLSDDEAGDLRKAFGSLYYAPSPEDRKQRIAAMEKLDSMGARGNEILDHLREELSNFDGLIPRMGKGREKDIFSNPIASIRIGLMPLSGKGSSFGDTAMADGYRRMIRREKPEESAKEVPLVIRSEEYAISLNQYTLRDAKEAFGLIDRNRAHLSQFGDRTAAKYPTPESFEDSVRNPKIPQRLRFGIRGKDGAILGSINLTPDSDNPRKGEIGYYLGGEFQGKGIMTKAVKMLTDYAFGSLGYEALYGKVTMGNNASARVLEKNGYVYSGTEGDQMVYSRSRANPHGPGGI